ncbi:MULTISPECIES: hypothetical protein [unclassified Paenibacillus]|uniref:hypothetical protein n=1 Tax=unclassified Paenibacillus TaxID=185978 RepID=UPI00117CB6E4|nr:MULTISPECIES: hypothetical protein [unclassified Paenibacillus]
MFQSLLSPDLYDLLFSRNTSGDKGERFAFTQSFRSLRCVSAGGVPGILILSLGTAKEKASTIESWPLCTRFNVEREFVSSIEETKKLPHSW